MSSRRRNAVYRSIKRFMIRTAPPIEVLAMLTGANATLVLLFLFGVFDC